MKKLHNKQQQKGIVLITALIFMAVLTLLGLSAIDGTVVESKLALNNQERIKAFQMSEAGLLAYSNLVNNQEIYNQLKANGTIDASSVLANGDTIITPMVSNGQSLTDTDNTQIIYKGEYTPPRSTNTAQVFSSNLFSTVYFEVVSTGRNAWEDTNSDGKADGVVRTVTIRNAVLKTALK